MDGARMIQFRDYLAQRGLKVTRQREAIAEVLFAAERHLSLTQLLERSKAIEPSIGFATVYRTMKLMSESGLAEEHKFADNGQSHYEVTGVHHDHLICVECGRIVEYEDEEVERRQEAVARAYGFEVVSHRHEIYGRCVANPCPYRTGAVNGMPGAAR